MLQAFPYTATPVFKTGALNHSATLPAQEFQSLSVGLARTQCERGPDLHPSRHFERNPATRAPKQYPPGGASEGDRSSVHPNNASPDWVASSGVASTATARVGTTNPPCAVAHHREKQRGSRARCMEHVTGARKIMGGGIGRNVPLRRADANSGRDGIVPAPLPQLERTLVSRTLQPAGSSTGARSWPSSGQEIRWRQCRGCACYTYHSDARPNLLKLSEFLVGTTELFLCPRARAGYPNPLAVKTQALER